MFHSRMMKPSVPPLSISCDWLNDYASLCPHTNTLLPSHEPRGFCVWVVCHHIPTSRKIYATIFIQPLQLVTWCELTGLQSPACKKQSIPGKMMPYPARHCTWEMKKAILQEHLLFNFTEWRDVTLTHHSHKELHVVMGIRGTNDSESEHLTTPLEGIV